MHRIIYVAICLIIGSNQALSSTLEVIAHRGASGYLPDHTLAAKAMAHAMSPDYIEQDLVMTKDDHIVVLHDLYLDNISNVAALHPTRARQDGHFYVIDFTLNELKTLSISSPFKTIKGNLKAKYPNRFPLFKSRFSIHTFAEEIELIQGLNQATGKNIGIYPEIKAPWFHRQHDKDISKAVLKVLKRYGYQARQDKVLLQSFDPTALKRINADLLPSMNMSIRLVQLIAETEWQETQMLIGGNWQNLNYDNMLTDSGLKEIATYAQGIGPWHGSMLTSLSKMQVNSAAKLVAKAQSLGLVVHPYTFRTDDLPNYVNSYKEWLVLYQRELKVNGIFTDFPDKTRELIAN